MKHITDVVRHGTVCNVTLPQISKKQKQAIQRRATSGIDFPEVEDEGAAAEQAEDDEVEYEGGMMNWPHTRETCTE